MSVDMSTMSGRDAREIRTDNHMIDSRFGPVRVVRMFPSVEDYFHGRADADAPHLFFSPGWGEKVQTSWMFGAALATGWCAHHVQLSCYEPSDRSCR